MIKYKDLKLIFRILKYKDFEILKIKVLYISIN